MSAGILHTLSVGSAGPRVAFLHGLFGQGRNWSQIAKAVSGPHGDEARCLLVDLPDHGRSPWSDAFSYAAYADAVATTLRAHGEGEPWVLVGHSLGGKVAMLVALRHPELVERLAVVDIAPVGYGDLHRFSGYMTAMASMPLSALASRGQAEEHLRAAAPEEGVRAFLLQNLRRDGDSWRWQANLDLFRADAALGSGSRIADFPIGPAQLDSGEVTPYDGPVLWLVGGDSGYVRDGDDDIMRALFPKVRQVTVKGAGHWVHSEAPQVTIAALRRFAGLDACR